MGAGQVLDPMEIAAPRVAEVPKLGRGHAQIHGLPMAALIVLDPRPSVQVAIQTNAVRSQPSIQHTH